jgi:prophage regulatory protein|uniref:DNA-binding transcriptional activator CP4-57 prophage n=1 Tax=mine drainage metagenome TaxID=410659 RepID=E6QGL0_9ZZZZ
MMNQQIEQRILRLPQVMELVGLRKTAVYQRIKENSFPAPIKLGSASGWIQRDIEDWINQQVARQQGQ